MPSKVTSSTDLNPRAIISSESWLTLPICIRVVLSTLHCSPLNLPKSKLIFLRVLRLSTLRASPYCCRRQSRPPYLFPCEIPVPGECFSVCPLLSSSDPVSDPARTWEALSAEKQMLHEDPAQFLRELFPPPYCTVTATVRHPAAGQFQGQNFEKFPHLRN